mmetsp:Transcript_40829/g.62260  ORF Transcript_40829/g.62260 Transcript_40829/m.62260 type:complete len:90 (-) Transcript_40829:42-311(-)
MAAYYDSEKKAVKSLDRILHKNKPELQNGIELNRILMSDLRKERNLQDHILKKTYSLLQKSSQAEDSRSNYQKLQVVHNRPGLEASKVR